tara:strand:- start:360 stop:1223 length:864 start_codon:yes stop_codon:yes gene_type:complete
MPAKCLLTFIGIILLASAAFSSANEKIPKNETTVFNETFSWQAMGNIALIYNPSLLQGQDQGDGPYRLGLSLLLDIYYKGFFIQSNHRRTSGILQGAEFGYQLVVTPKWELDLISKTYVSSYIPKDIIDHTNKNIPTLEGLKERKAGNGIGLRYSRYHHNSVLSVDLASLSPLSDADGWIIDVFYSYMLPYRNWDIYLSTGYTHYSEKVMDYYYGINENEVSSARPFYQSDAGNRLQLELFAQYPIADKWSFTGGITHSYYSKSVKESPLVDTQHVTQVMLGVLYVF